MKKKEKVSKYGNCLANSWTLDEDVKALPEGDLKTAIIEWQKKQVIQPGAMSLSGIFYRSNLQYIMENLEKPGLIDEIKKAVAPKPKEYGQLELKLGRQFKQVFGVALHPYMNLITGFDIVKFDDEVVKPPDGTSSKQAIEQRWGQEAVELIKELM